MNIDQLVHTANFAQGQLQAEAQAEIWNLAQAKGIYPASLADLYLARGQNQTALNFTVPAFNLRGLSYQSAQAAFKAASRHQVSLFIFEIARSEMSYTDQPPAVYASNILGAAIKTNWNRPVFIQGDHFQVKAQNPGQPQHGEIEKIKNLILEAINAGFYNLDIDTSTLVDLQKKEIIDQQQPNFLTTAELAQFIRAHQPPGVTISLGGEIGEVGKTNSTAEDLMAFMQGFSQAFGQTTTGLSKIAIQTGTSHGGIVAPDGRIIMANVDFRTLKKLSQLARNQYGLGGAVQHGASTLPIQLFEKFPLHETLEIHLATGFQNFILDHVVFPKSLKKDMYHWGLKNLDQPTPGETKRQYLYKQRKNFWAPFKQQLWNLEDAIMARIMKGMDRKFVMYFKRLNVINTYQLVDQWIKPVKINKSVDDFLIVTSQDQTAADLAD